jgi:hypothetical protein
MFRRIFELEGFVGETTTTNQNIGTYYSQSLPNYVPTGDPSLPLSQLTNTAEVSGAVNTSVKRDPVLPNEYATYGIAPDLINSRETACSQPGAGRDTFDHLTSLASSQDPRSVVRCGWMHNTNAPFDGKGAFGVSAGPFVSKAPGVWMWDLQEAKQRVHESLCRDVRDCGDIDAYPFQGRCGFCKSSGRGIPIEGGRVAYPANERNACSAANLVTSSANCPRPDPAVLATPEGQAARATCDPLPNGNLTRDCLIQKAKQSGCSEDGTLIAALRGGSDLNYIDNLKNRQAYGVFQSRAAIPMNEQFLRQGQMTVSQALTEFGRLNEQAASQANSGLAFAARDLCLSAGTIDQFDFCVEIADGTRPPFSLDCLQKEFLRSGGQKSGAMYPTNSNVVEQWNSLNTWGDVKRKIQKMKEETQSPDRGAQEAAMLNFLGVNLDEKSKPAFAGERGCEVFYFVWGWKNMPDSNPIFIGRRIQASVPKVNDQWGDRNKESLNLKGTYGTTDIVWEKSFIWITNISVPTTDTYTINVKGDDGYATVLNRPFRDITISDPRKTYDDTKKQGEVSFINYFPAQLTTGKWILGRDRPNLVKGFWFQGGWNLEYEFDIRDKNGNVANYSATLTQDAYAPLCNFEAVSDADRFTYNMNYFFGDRRLGDLNIQWDRIWGSPSASSSMAAQMGLNKKKLLLDLPSGSRIATKTFFKGSAFQTFTTCCMFNSVPNNAANVVANWHFQATDSRYAHFQIRMYGTGDYRTGQIALRYDYDRPQEVGGGENFKVETGVAYLVMIRVVKTGTTYSGMELCLGKLKDLQANPNSLKISSRISFTANPSRFENIDSKTARQIIVQGETPMTVAWMRMYDYYLDGENLKREANDNWLGMYQGV